MSEVRGSIGDTILEILEAVYNGDSSEIEQYAADEQITREQLAAAAITSMLFERYTVGVAN